MKQKLSIGKRRRRGGTSPPLPCVEPNPGPRVIAKRKSGKQDSVVNLKKGKRQGSLHLSPEELSDLEQELRSGKSDEAIIAKGKYSKKVVGRYGSRFRQTGEVQQRLPIKQAYVEENSDGPDESTESEQERKITFNRLSDFEKGEIYAMYSHNYSTSEITAWINCAGQQLICGLRDGNMKGILISRQWQDGQERLFQGKIVLLKF